MPREELMETRKRLDEYLDGALDASAKRELEAALARDPEISEMLKAMRGERELRAAAYASYMPAAADAKAFAAQVMEAFLDEASAPIGHVGALVWTRRIAGIAAGLIIAIGSFMAGRATVPQPTVVQQSARAPEPTYTFGYVDPNSGQPVYEMFSSYDEMTGAARRFQESQPQFRQQPTFVGMTRGSM